METYLRNIENESYYVAIFNANKIKNKKIFIDEFWDAFNIPYENNYSLDSLHDCMTELSWIKEKYILVEVRNYQNFLKKNNNNDDLIYPNLLSYKRFWDKSNMKCFKIELM